MERNILEIKNLTTCFFTDDGTVKATDRVSINVGKGQTVCLVGESGSGKSVTSLAVMRLIDYAGGFIQSGNVMFHGQDLAAKDLDEMMQIRGNKIAMIFQDPMSALNPVFTVGDQIAESLMLHQNMSKIDAFKKAIEMLRLVGIPAPEVRVKQYPHEMSGGMCQRVVIAMALACKPEMLIADEPTTALDVTVQAQILDLLRRLQKELGMSILLITHDMGVAAEMADRIAVMYAGTIVEEGTVERIFDEPRHPYTIGLLQSIPGFEGERGGELYTIQGTIPSITQLPTGCRFHPRCPHAIDKCRKEEPILREVVTGQQVACWLNEDVSNHFRINQRANSVAGSKAEVNRQ
ncbi:ABC transporter ATP-binding protein [Brevibacillus porteri]|uniref:Peptide ABC transporter ATP-binding protein n=1 Tax=Brevibacillus porteri TaxID=2126350 RepID=A0ABX5FJW7_9BACL|nr:ABC transporter ATP-binding protein [Brevibacillus porteri]MED1801420.1 ABC transporter ATP-binding protein [Brevibacillus porteri]MED2132808.1 ABC transporter ATP-binding protein [Brevibacillus porteri]MED2747791.1 ABC transporter ATP-binding protein [Brevibacillus porteri]MED2817571.1 ABC transporter ATP-binding protein [Brevibacillus porteri]MED2895513.1 ABC transporter ATP-binding protein [Brevibacillus porteri]